MEGRRARAVLVDTEQTVGQLTAIQLSGWMNLPIFASSALLLRENSFYGAALTILVANGFLWFIRLIIILMSHQKRLSTLDLARNYLGQTGGYFVGALCILSSLAWFIAQTTAASNTLLALIPVHESERINTFVQISVLIGVVSTFLCMNGMVVLRRLSVFAFPVLLVSLIVVFLTMPFHWPEGENTSLSLSGLALIMGVNLGMTADLPTFFRHSRSLSTSIAALTWVQGISLVMAWMGLFFGSIVTDSFSISAPVVLQMHSEVLRLALVILVLVSVVCANVSNVYTASVGWEVLAPSPLVGKREYLILGLCLTTIFILVAGLFSIGLLLEVSDSSLINLCIVFLIAYFISRIQRRTPDDLEQKTYFGAWLSACSANSLQYMHVFGDKVSPLFVGFMSIFLVLFFFLGARFVTPRRGF